MDEVDLDDLHTLDAKDRNKRQYVWRKLDQSRSIATKSILDTFSLSPQFITLDAGILVLVIEQIAGKEVEERDTALEEVMWTYKRIYDSQKR